jgi:hypothetical protein
MSTFNDTVGSYIMSSGTLGGTGTLTAATYGLNGGTISANLGTGTATVATGTTALNGTLGATTVNVNSGSLNLGSADRLANTAAVTLAGGTLGMSTFSDTVGTFIMSSGTLGGSGTLTAATYGLNGGTVSANLGTGTATVATGTTALNGTLGATTVNVNSGVVNLGSSDRLANTAAVTVAGGTLGMSTFNDSVGAVTLTSGSITGTTGVLTGTSFAMNGTGSASAILGGSGATLTKTGTGTTTTLSKTNSYTGATTVTSGTLNVASGGSIASSSSTVAAGAAMIVNGTAGAVTLNGSLSGAGTVGALELNNGSSLNPGNSPGLLSASSSKWNAGATYNFQMTSAIGTAGTSWDLLDVSTLLDLSALSSSAKFNLNIETAGPLTGYNVNTPFAWTFAQSGSLALPSGYAFVSPLAASSIDITSLFNLTFIDATSFTGAVTSGFKIIAYNDPNGSERIALVPEPSTGSLLLFGFGGLALLRLARRRSVG